MKRRNWKLVRATSAPEALRLCKDFALERKNLSVERIATLIGVSADLLYKWLGNGRMPVLLVPTYEVVCGCSFVSDWLATASGKLVIAMPNGHPASQDDLVQLNTGFATALQLLTNLYAGKTSDPTETVAALTAHLEQVAGHRANVAAHAEPELDFTTPA